MLRDQQASYLLSKCEQILKNRQLTGTRGDLKKPQSRAAAVWELLVFDEVATIGVIDERSFTEGNPDVLSHLHVGGSVWFEATFAHPQYSDESHLAQQVDNWIVEKVQTLSLSPCAISCALHRNPDTTSKIKQRLPKQKGDFFKSADVETFFDSLKQYPDTPQTVRLIDFDITLSYEPLNRGPFRSTLGGPVLEHYETVEEHPIFKKLKTKSHQHDTPCPRVVCIAVDKGSLLSTFTSPTAVSINNVIHEAFGIYKSISAAIFVPVSDTINHHGLLKIARPKVFANNNARHPLSAKQLAAISSMTFNRWRYYFSINQYDKKKREGFTDITGGYEISPRPTMNMLKLPAHIIVDTIAGRTNALSEYGDCTTLGHILRPGATIIAASCSQGDIQTGKPDMLSFGVTYITPSQDQSVLSVEAHQNGLTLSVSCSLLLDYLAGRCKPPHNFHKADLKRGTPINSCTLDSAANTVKFELGRPYASVYWPQN